MTKGVKTDQGKTRFDLMDYEVMAEIADAFAFGLTKYKPHNWKGGIAYSRLFAACMRHLAAWWQGEERASDSGIHHLAHAGANIVMMLWHVKYKPELDDRFKHDKPKTVQRVRRRRHKQSRRNRRKTNRTKGR